MSETTNTIGMIVSLLVGMVIRPAFWFAYWLAFVWVAARIVVGVVKSNL